MLVKPQLALALVIVCSAISAGQSSASPGITRAERAHPQPAATFSADDGLSVIAAALDSKSRTIRRDDCSHLVHAIYERAGFSYKYADSRDLYRGTGEFRRVSHPQAGDLVVWKGHVGIVVSPAQRLFFSSLRHGPGIDAYDAKYWKKRGPVRFYRYIKTGSEEGEYDPD